MCSKCYAMAEYASWTDMRCQKCGAYFVAHDKFGFFCVVSGCGWTDSEDVKNETDRAAR
jgi:hypothetical protein